MLAWPVKARAHKRCLDILGSGIAAQSYCGAVARGSAEVVAGWQTELEIVGRGRAG